MTFSPNFITPKKGDPHNLCGKVIAYAFIKSPPQIDDSLESNSSNGILAIGGDFRKQQNLKDFLKAEFPGKIEEGFEKLFSKMKKDDLLPDDVDAPNIEDKMDMIKHMEIIPVPAKILHFESEEELLQEDADIYFLGEFEHSANAHLSVTSFPIMYQARFKEMGDSKIRAEINSILAGLDIPQTPTAVSVYPWREKHHSDFGEDLLRVLISEILPELASEKDERALFEKSSIEFRKFMQGYKHLQDIEKIIQHAYTHENSKAELYCRKVNAILFERFEELDEILKEIEKL
jgi:hypothetical protein